MKKLFLMTALAMGAAGCADTLRPIQIREAKPTDFSCATQDVAQYAGTLDLASLDNGATPEQIRYVMTFTIASQFQPEELAVEDAPLIDESRNNFVLEEIEYNFESQPARTFETERRPGYLQIPVGSQDSVMNVTLIPPKALATVRQLVTDTGEPVTLFAKFRLKGRLVSGVQTESDEISFPITVFNSGKKCPAGTVLAYTGSCGSPSGTNTSFACEAAPAP